MQIKLEWQPNTFTNASLNINTQQLETISGNIRVVSWDWKAANFKCLRSVSANLTVLFMNCFSLGNLNLLLMHKVTPLMQNVLPNFYCFLLYFIFILMHIFSIVVQLLRLFRALQTSRVLNILIYAHWRMN